MTHDKSSPTALKRFIYPFPGKGPSSNHAPVEIEQAQQYFDAWSQVGDGFYPMGQNGQWHGGIHFDAATGQALQQDAGIRCIADGEVIAYRIDRRYPKVSFDKGEATYSSGFVLVRHRLQLPPELAEDKTPPPAPETPSVILYSLYMHLRHGEAYQTDAKLACPKFWPVDELKRKVSDRVTGKNPLGGITNPTVEDQNRKGMNVRAAPNVNGTKMGWLPQGARLTLKPGNGNAGWREIVSVEGGQMLFDSVTNPANSIAGWVAERLLDALPAEPVQYDSVYIPPQPIPIAAGELVGHLGEYLRYYQEVENGIKNRPLTHLELFAGPEAHNFIIQSQKLARAKNVEAHKTLLFVKEGARLVQATETDLELRRGEGIRLSQDSPKEGPWVRVERGALDIVARSSLDNYNSTKPDVRSYTAKDGSVAFFYSALNADGSGEILADAFTSLSKAVQKLRENRKVFKPSGFAWIERKEPMSANAIRELTQPLAAWSTFPLQVKKAENAPAAYRRVVPVNRLKSVKDDQGHRWWEVEVATDQKNVEPEKSEPGWACEQGHTNVWLCSPWEWPGFAYIALDKTTPSEWLERLLTHRYKPDNTLLKRLFEIMDWNNDGDLIPGEIRRAWKASRLSQTLSRLVILHDSEWGLAMSAWDKLDKLLLENEEIKALFPNWVEEKKRIKKLRWWDEVKGHHGFPDSFQVYHFHPLGVIENFSATGACACIKEFNPELLKIIAPHASAANIQKYCSFLNQTFEKYDFDCIGKAHLLAQLLHESGSFAYTKEMGNLTGADYYPYIGRGLLQITWKDNYMAYGKFVTENGNEFLSSSDQQRLEQVPYSVDTADWFWRKRQKDMLIFSAEDDMLYLTALVNGAYNGYLDRLLYLNRIIKTMNMSEHLIKNHSGEYSFAESRIYGDAKFSFGWGLWHDPGINKHGVNKNALYAIDGYRRYLQLTSPSHREKRKWYGISILPGKSLIQIQYVISVVPNVKHYDYRAYCNARIQALGG